MKKIKILLLSTILFFTNIFHGINVIFDLNGVLLRVDKSQSIKQIGAFNLFMFGLGSLLRLRNPLTLRYRLFEALNQMECNYKNEFGATDEKGNPLPDIMCAWMAGATNYENILVSAEQFTQNNQDFFNNALEKKIINKIIKIIFGPQTVVQSSTIIKDGLKVVKKCKKQGHTIFILSNWDRESTENLLAAFPKLFSLFDPDKIIISGEIGLIKPDPQIYQYLLDQHNLDPQTCIFFDDQEKNVEAANQLKIHGVVCKNMNHKKIMEHLDSFVEQQNQELPIMV